MNFTEAPVKIEMKAESTGGEGPDLAKFPLLTYAPGQHGEGVRVASNGVLVEDIVEAATHSHDESVVTSLFSLALAFSITWDEMFDALRYARAIDRI